MALGALVGALFGANAAWLEIPGRLVLRALSALAPPLVLLAIIRALLQFRLTGRQAGRLVGLLLLNTLVAIGIGLAVANLLQPGHWAGSLQVVEPVGPAAKANSTLTQFLDSVPKSLLGPLGDDGKVLSVIFLAVVLGLALRRVKEHPLRTVEDLVHVALESLIVGAALDHRRDSAGRVRHRGQHRGRQRVWRLRRPGRVRGGGAGGTGVAGDLLSGAGARGIVGIAARLLLRGTRDALVMAFSTGSSTATMPVTYACLREKVGLREESASMGALVGANFNNDGTALYEAMSALFVSQLHRHCN